jgi:ribosome modulation factor
MPKDCIDAALSIKAFHRDDSRTVQAGIHPRVEDVADYSALNNDNSWFG